MPTYYERELTESEKEAINLASTVLGMDGSEIINAVQRVIDELNKEAKSLKDAVEYMMGIEPHSFEELTYCQDSRKSEEEKLPKKLRNGWK